MKIGIFTQPLKSNYGGILQNYAMQVVLKRMGHEPWTVDYLRFTWWDWFVVAVKVTIKKCLGRKANYPKSPRKVQRQENPLRRFALKYIQLTQPRVKYPSKSILQTYGFDALLVGSDQTWRPMYNGKIYDMYLQLAERMNVKRVAYAASFGTDKWEYTPEQESECARLAKLFDAISVREASGVGLCREHFGVEATHVLDPTLLLTADDYNELCKDIEPREPFVFAYILDMSEQKVAEIKAFAEAKGLPYFIKSADADITDERLNPILLLINALFYIEQESVRRKHTPEQRLKFRLKYSRKIVEKIMKKLETIRLAGNEYRTLVHRAVNYILDDKEVFQKFLLDGHIEMHNNAIEPMLRHIAIGRRNWLHTGSRFSAENIAFMYSLLESCKLNNVNFGEYIEDTLTRLMKGEKADASFLPNKYVPRPKEESKTAA